MALTAAERAQVEMYNQSIEKEDRGILDITAYDYYFDKIRPEIVDFNKNYHSDLELNTCFLEIMNHADGFMAKKRYTEFLEAFSPMIITTEAKDYYKKHMSDATDEEKKALENIKEKYENIRLIIMSDTKPERILTPEKDMERRREANKKREEEQRLNYQPPNGDNQGYNKDILSNRHYNRKPKTSEELAEEKRIPNINNKKVNIH